MRRKRRNVDERGAKIEEEDVDEEEGGKERGPRTEDRGPRRGRSEEPGTMSEEEEED